MSDTDDQTFDEFGYGGSGLDELSSLATSFDLQHNNPSQNRGSRSSEINRTNEDVLSDFLDCDGIDRTIITNATQKTVQNNTTKKIGQKHSAPTPTFATHPPSPKPFPAHKNSAPLMNQQRTPRPTESNGLTDTGTGKSFTSVHKHLEPQGFPPSKQSLLSARTLQTLHLSKKKQSFLSADQSSSSPIQTSSPDTRQTLPSFPFSNDPDPKIKKDKTLCDKEKMEKMEKMEKREQKERKRMEKEKMKREKREEKERRRMEKLKKEAEKKEKRERREQEEQKEKEREREREKREKEKREKEEEMEKRKKAARIVPSVVLSPSTPAVVLPVVPPVTPTVVLPGVPPTTAKDPLSKTGITTIGNNIGNNICNNNNKNDENNINNNDNGGQDEMTQLKEQENLRYDLEGLNLSFALLSNVPRCTEDVWLGMPRQRYLFDLVIDPVPNPSLSRLYVADMLAVSSTQDHFSFPSVNYSGPVYSSSTDDRPSSTPINPVGEIIVNNRFIAEEPSEKTKKTGETEQTGETGETGETEEKEEKEEKEGKEGKEEKEKKKKEKYAGSTYWPELGSITPTFSAWVRPPPDFSSGLSVAVGESISPTAVGLIAAVLRHPGGSSTLVPRDARLAIERAPPPLVWQAIWLVSRGVPLCGGLGEGSSIQSRALDALLAIAAMDARGPTLAAANLTESHGFDREDLLLLGSDFYNRTTARNAAADTELASEAKSRHVASCFGPPPPSSTPYQLPKSMRLVFPPPTKQPRNPGANQSFGHRQDFFGQSDRFVASIDNNYDPHNAMGLDGEGPSTMETMETLATMATKKTDAQRTMNEKKRDRSWNDLIPKSGTWPVGQSVDRLIAQYELLNQLVGFFTITVPIERFVSGSEENPQNPSAQLGPEKNCGRPEKTTQEGPLQPQQQLQQSQQHGQHQQIAESHQSLLLAARTMLADNVRRFLPPIPPSLQSTVINALWGPPNLSPELAEAARDTDLNKPSMWYSRAVNDWINDRNGTSGVPTTNGDGLFPAMLAWWLARSTGGDPKAAAATADGLIQATKRHTVPALPESNMLRTVGSAFVLVRSALEYAFSLGRTYPKNKASPLTLPVFLYKPDVYSLPASFSSSSSSSSHHHHSAGADNNDENDDENHLTMQTGQGSEPPKGYIRNLLEARKKRAPLTWTSFVRGNERFLGLKDTLAQFPATLEKKQLMKCDDPNVESRTELLLRYLPQDPVTSEGEWLNFFETRPVLVKVSAKKNNRRTGVAKPCKNVEPLANKKKRKLFLTTKSDDPQQHIDNGRQEEIEGRFVKKRRGFSSAVATAASASTASTASAASAAASAVVVAENGNDGKMMIGDDNENKPMDVDNGVDVEEGKGGQKKLGEDTRLNNVLGLEGYTEKAERGHAAIPLYHALARLLTMAADQTCPKPLKHEKVQPADPGLGPPYWMAYQILIGMLTAGPHWFAWGEAYDEETQRMMPLLGELQKLEMRFKTVAREVMNLTKPGLDNHVKISPHCICFCSNCRKITSPSSVIRLFIHTEPEETITNFLPISSGFARTSSIRICCSDVVFNSTGEASKGSASLK